jgi:hypothetical protein
MRPKLQGSKFLQRDKFTQTCTNMKIIRTKRRGSEENTSWEGLGHKSTEDCFRFVGFVDGI